MATRHHNDGLRKLCDCPRRHWPKCAHPWHFNYKPRGGAPWRFSLDAEIGHHIESKTDAETLAGDIRTAINAGTYVRTAARRKAAVAAATITTPDAVTLTTFATIYVERVSKVRERNKGWKNDRYMFAQLAAFPLPDGSRLGDKALGAFTEDDLEAFVVTLRAKGRATSTRNSYVQLLKKSFRWATKKGYITSNPTLSDDSTLKRGKIAKRHRRLLPDIVDDRGHVREPGEERRLLAAAGARLQWLIIAALETACRLGELLALTWADVTLERRELTVRAETAKDNDRRVLPISPRLAGVLEMARTDPAGREYKPSAYVFGELGVRVKSVKRAWVTAVLKGHGHTPRWAGEGRLSLASRAAMQLVDLHFHDLRHEGASRMLEAGWPLHHIQHMLGHASLEQTSTYLNVEKTGLQDSMRRFGVPAGIRCNPVAIPPSIGAERDAERMVDAASNSLIN
jgi:integrase